MESFLSFNVGKELFACNVKYVQSILENTNLTTLPNTPKYLLGVLNLRGEALPVVDLRVKFGVESTEITINTCILVMEIQVNGTSIKFGSMVDNVKEVFEAETDKYQEPPKISTTEWNRFISGIYSQEDKFIQIVNPEKILFESDIAELSNYSKKAS